LFSSQENALYSSSYNGISHKPKYRVEPSISSSTQIETSIPGSEVVTGFTLLDRVYLRGGTFFIVTANKSAFPPKRNMIAPGLDMGAGHDMEPTDKVQSYKDHCGVSK
jgi:protein O-GlcNAc transferase